MNRASSVATEVEVTEEIATNANGETIDIETGEIDRETEKLEEPQHINEIHSR